MSKDSPKFYPAKVSHYTVITDKVEINKLPHKNVYVQIEYFVGHSVMLFEKIPGHNFLEIFSEDSSINMVCISKISCQSFV